MEIRFPNNPEEWSQYFALRYKVLRQDWNQPEGSEILPDDDHAIHLIAIQDEQVLGAARMHYAENYAQIRCVAIDKNHQYKGIGKKLMLELEKIAKTNNIQKIILEARDNAIPFYEKIGFKIAKMSYLLFGTIPHFTMEKSI
ncbi:MAG: hypothetical protein RIR51_448 [Bacteroidota bacterium]|jgi:ribosomal protein S18 acetylase RimI-like enzyme